MSIVVALPPMMPPYVCVKPVPVRMGVCTGTPTAAAEVVLVLLAAALVLLVVVGVEAGVVVVDVVVETHCACVSERMLETP